MDYPIVIVPLSEEDGGGWMGYVPDLPGCMSDGETAEEAVANTRDAVAEWLDADQASQSGVPPAPGSASAQARREREEMISLIGQLEHVVRNREDIDDRLYEIEKRIEDIREALENIESWSRFATLGGRTVVTITSSKSKRVLVHKA